MSYIGDLIAKLCPNGVELTPIGEHISYEQPNRYLVSSKEYDPSYSTPVLTAGQTFILGFTNESHGIYPASKDEPVIIFDDFTTAHKWVDFPFKAKSGAMKMLRPFPNSGINLKYFYYLLSTIEIDHSQHARYWISEFAPMNIPVPPRQVQDEIVRILDLFTQLEAELEAELEARKTQVSFYTEKIFTDHKYKFESKALREIASCYTGATPLTTISEYWEGGTIPWISSGEVNKRTIKFADSFITKRGYEAASTKMVPSGSVLIALAGQGKTRGMVARTRLEACTNQSLCAIVPHEGLLSDYLYFYMRTQYQNYRALSSGEGGRGGLNLRIIKSISIPVPSIAHQNEIVSLLEQFEDLISNPALSISTEITLRRQQYEYFRTELLKFKELEFV